MGSNNRSLIFKFCIQQQMLGSNNRSLNFKFCIQQQMLWSNNRSLNLKFCIQQQMLGSNNRSLSYESNNRSLNLKFCIQQQMLRSNNRSFIYEILIQKQILGIKIYHPTRDAGIRQQILYLGAVYKWRHRSAGGGGKQKWHIVTLRWMRGMLTKVIHWFSGKKY